jgi:hypothetical protein
MTTLLVLTVITAVVIAVGLAKQIRLRQALENLLGRLIQKTGAEHVAEQFMADSGDPDPDDDHAADDGRVR